MTMRLWLLHLLMRGIRLVQRLVQWLLRPSRPKWARHAPLGPPRPAFAQPKPAWVRKEIIRLKTLMPTAGCRMIAHHFNRRWASRRQMTVGKSYVAETVTKHHYLILEARRKLKHRVPRPMPRNRVWGCDLMVKTDAHGRSHFVLGMLDHASRACLQLQRLADKSAWTLVHELIQVVKRYGHPRFLRTDNEAVLVSRVVRLGLWALGIRHQRIEPGCPWQNGRIERFFGTVKRALAQESVFSGQDLDNQLTRVRQWYNHVRPHDHLRGRTPAEAWAGVDVFAARSG